MSTETVEKPLNGQALAPETQALERAATPQLPEAVVRRGIDEFQWRTLTNSLFPGAKSESVLMVVDYCKARHLDPLKKPCHIVPMRVRDRDGEWRWRDVILPGIYEYRITAHRTGLYLGHTKAVYGPDQETFGVTAPAWCEMTMKRWHRDSKQVIDFPVQVFFAEVCATKTVDKGKSNEREEANDRWWKAPIQMLTKCTEAAGLREAFPEELGGEPTAEEMEGRHAVVDADGTIAMPVRLTPSHAEPTATVQNTNGTTAATEGEPKAANGTANTVPNGGSSVAVEPDEAAAQKAGALAEGQDRIVELVALKKGNGEPYWTGRTERGIAIWTGSTTFGPQLEQAKTRAEEALRAFKAKDYRRAITFAGTSIVRLTLGEEWKGMKRVASLSWDDPANGNGAH